MNPIVLIAIILASMALGYYLRSLHKVSEWIEGYRAGYHSAKSGDEWADEDELHRD